MIKTTSVSKLYWQEFRRKFRKEKVYKDFGANDHERETLFRSYQERSLKAIRTYTNSFRLEIELAATRVRFLGPLEKKWQSLRSKSPDDGDLRRAISCTRSCESDDNKPEIPIGDFLI